MGNHSQFQKIICVFFIFTILIYFSGCYSPRVAISKTDLPLPDSGIYNYEIHMQNSNYLIRNGIISNGTLSGKGKKNIRIPCSNKIHIYLSSDTIVKLSPEKIFKIPIEGIVKVETEKVSVGKTIALVAGVAVGSYIVYYGMVALLFKIGSAFGPTEF